MTTLVGVALEGSISTGISEGTVATDCACSPPQPGSAFQLALQSESRWGDAAVSSPRVSVTSPAAFVTLGLPPVGTGYQFRGRLVYFRSLEANLTWTLELTQRTAGAVEVVCGGSLLLELPEEDELTLLRVQGTGSFEWLVVGRVEATA